jgi:hypothetical protein
MTFNTDQVQVANMKVIKTGVQSRPNEQQQVLKEIKMSKPQSVFYSGLILSVLLTWSPLSLGHKTLDVSHGGGTDKCGCHTKSATGEYHCHTRKQRGGSCPAVVMKDNGIENQEQSSSN